MSQSTAETTDSAGTGTGVTNGNGQTAATAAKGRVRTKLKPKTTTPARSGATARIRALLTENPSRKMSDVMAVLVREQLVASDGQSNAERLFYKVRRAVWVEKGLLPRGDGDGDTQPAGSRTATAARPATRPAVPQPTVASTTGRFDSAVGIAVVGATQTGDPEFDPFESLVLTKQVLADLPTISAENPLDAAVRLTDLTDQVGGTVNLRRCLAVAARLDAITRQAPGAGTPEPATV